MLMLGGRKGCPEGVHCVAGAGEAGVGFRGLYWELVLRLTDTEIGGAGFPVFCFTGLVAEGGFTGLTVAGFKGVIDKLGRSLRTELPDEALACPWVDTP